MSSVLEITCEGFDKGTEGIKNMRKSLHFRSPIDDSCFKRILNPQGEFLRRWNKIFVLASVIAVSIDPLFFYIRVVDKEKNCIDLDHRLKIAAIVLRSSTDIFYVVHIFFQFRTGFIDPSSRVFSTVVMIEDLSAIARRYLSSYFLIDMLAVLPLPQVILIIIPKLRSSAALNAENLLWFVVLLQYVPRLHRIIRLYREVSKSSGIITQRAWTGVALNLFLFMLASHAIGAFWYFLSVERQETCWRHACSAPGQKCLISSWRCERENAEKNNFLGTFCPLDRANETAFDFGIYLSALNSEIVQSRDFPQKLFYCFWWGLRNLSSLGQNLLTSTYIGEILFAVFISICGLVLFSLLIGNMQTYLQSNTVRLEEMRVKWQDAERWMSHCLLPDSLKERIRRYKQYKWQETRGVDEEHLLRNLPTDLRREINRHRYLALLMRVPLFEVMDEDLLDAMCDCAKPAFYTEGSYIVREGGPVCEMLFVKRGKLVVDTTSGSRSGFFDSHFLKAGDFCGEELLTWALDPHTSSNLPTSTRTVWALSEVEAFALKADDLKSVAFQVRRLHSKQLQHTLRFYSQQWRTWAACFIQVAWRRYSKKKFEESQQEEVLQIVVV